MVPYILHAGTCGDDAGTLAKISYDARDGPALRGGRQRDDGFAAAGFGRAAVEIHLPADAGEEFRADGVGADLAGQVNFQRGVDGHHFVLLADDGRVVDVFGRMKREQRIVVHVIVNLLRAEAEAGDDFAVVNRLAFAGDGAALDEFDEIVGDHFGVDAEVFLAL